MLGCMATPISLVISVSATQEGEDVPVPSPIDFRALPTSHWETVGISPPNSGYPIPLGSVLQGEGRVAQSWDIKSVSPLEAIVWG